MAHVLDGTDTVSGLYVPGPPKSLISHGDLNMPALEILNAVIQAGMTPAASSSADASAGWKQLMQAIRILAGRSGNGATLSNPTPALLDGYALGDVVTINATGVGSTPSNNLAFNNIFTESGGPFGSVNFALELNARYLNKIIIVRNHCGEVANFFGTSAVLSLKSGQIALLMYNGTTWEGLVVPYNTDGLLEGATNLYWTIARFNAAFSSSFGAAFTSAFGAETLDSLPDGTTRFTVNKKSGTFSLHLYDSANNDVASVTASYQIIDGKVFLSFQTLSGSTAAGNLRLTSASDAALPSDIRYVGSASKTILSICVNDGSDKVVVGTYDKATNKIQLLQSYPNSTNYVLGQMLSYNLNT